MSLKAWQNIPIIAGAIVTAFGCYGFTYFLVSGKNFLLSLIFYVIAFTTILFAKQFLDESFEEIWPELE